MNNLLDFVLHLDKHLQSLIMREGAWTYLILFGVLFAETGFVITPFLPGDSLLFVTGALAAAGTGRMSYRHFFAYNVVGAIVVLPLVPAVYEFWRARRESAGAQ